jgi:hypothetical protein
VIGHDDPRHGSDAGYYAGCHEDCCRTAHAARAWTYRQDTTPRLVTTAAVVRRLEALACQGWSLQALSRRLGKGRGYLRHVIAQQWCHRDTAEKIAALYDELCDVTCTDPTAGRVRALAERAGAVAPHAWLDVDRGLLHVTEVDEKPCCCPTNVPNRRTTYSLTCMGCGWAYALTGRAA